MAPVPSKPTVPAVPTVNVVDRTGKARETLSLDASVFAVPLHGPLLHQAVVRELAGQRAGTHDTKGRSEVSGGGRKPWRQKGTGRARQGSIRATQWKGGGKPFGPTPRRYAQDLPRQARRVALRSALSDKVASGHVTVVDELGLTDAKTKALLGVLAGLGVVGTPTLLVLAGQREAVERAGRNVPWLRVTRPGHLTVATLLRHDRIVFERRALLAVQEALLA